MFVVIAMFVSGCSVEDRELVVAFARSWAESHGVINEDGSPTMQAGARVFFGVSTGDEIADAAIDAGRVIKNINEADELVSQAEQYTYDDPPQMDKAIDSMNAAVRTRPDDWGIRNQRAAMLIESGQHDQARRDFDHARSLCQTNHCQKRQIENKIQLLADSLDRQKEQGPHVQCGTYTELEIAYREIEIVDDNRYNHEAYRQNAILMQGLARTCRGR